MNDEQNAHWSALMDPDKAVPHALSLMTILGYWSHILPSVATLLAVIWYVIEITGSPVTRRLCRDAVGLVIRRRPPLEREDTDDATG
jgi:hypothetical protein